MLSTPLSELDHSRRALIVAAVSTAVPDLAIDATATEYEWNDLEAWFSRAPEGSVPGTERVELRVVTGDDIGQFYYAALDPPRSYTWRFRGSTLSFEEFAGTFHDGVLAQFSVVGQSSDHHLQGLVTAYNFDASNGHAYFAYLRTLGATIPGAVTEGLAAFLSYIFENFPVRQLYCEVPEFNQHLIQGFGNTGLFDAVACYPAHFFSQGRFQDLHVHRVTRDAWFERFGEWTFCDRKP